MRRIRKETNTEVVSSARAKPKALTKERAEYLKRIETRVNISQDYLKRAKHELRESHEIISAYAEFAKGNRKGDLKAVMKRIHNAYELIKREELK